MKIIRNPFKVHKVIKFTNKTQAFELSMTKSQSNQYDKKITKFQLKSGERVTAQSGHGVEVELVTWMPFLSSSINASRSNGCDA